MPPRCFPAPTIVLLFGFALYAHADESPRKHWAFQPLVRPAAPRVKNADCVHTTIDRFVLAKLEAKGLRYSPQADKATLLRRASFDLIGLPPTPEELDAFVRDQRPDAYEQWLDRLLASPHFGERWGRHWLDGAGYVDVTGTDNDASIIRLGENRWKYRDHVVRAFNTDRPFDRFLLEQLAGDELVDWRTAKAFTPEIHELLIATGFLRTASDDTDENELNTLDIRYGVLHRTIEGVAGNLLGLTLNCAKCHDHKYEPITHEDYYRFQALFQPAFNPQQWLQPKQRQLAEMAPAEKVVLERANEKLQQQIDAGKKRLAALKADDKPARAEIEHETQTLQRQLKTWSHFQAVYDVGPATPTRLLRRGQPDRPAAEMRPGFPSALVTAAEESEFLASRGEGATSGRRLALARWLTDPATPASALVLRVRVNRIWQHLFGKGLVATADNFGVTGAKPTHPDLLDWLAAEFRESGQRLKPMLKLIMTSAVYRQDSGVRDQESDAKPRDERSDSRGSIDPDNQLLGRMRLRRLESESIRDAVLAASGQLDRAVGGAPIPVESRPDGTFVVSDKNLPTPTSASRRSLYLLARRNYHPTVLGVFDQPNLTTNCPSRATSAVVLQTLTMLNDPFFLEQARFLADRLEQGRTDEAARVALAFRLVLTREPSAREFQLCRDLLQRQRTHYLSQKMAADAAGRQAWVHLCHMLLNTSEFLYVP